VIIIKKIFYLALPIFSGSIIGLITSSAMDYGTLRKPPLSPPGFIFPIVWSVLYILMGISYFLFRNKYYKETKLESTIYYSQLIVNLLWSIFFFLLKWRFFTIIWTILLLILIIYIIKLFHRKNRISAYLNIPYLIWVIFALYLTIGTYILNI